MTATSLAEVRSLPRTTDVGAIVIGGDYQGLGIVRSLGRHGVPVVVIDDEPSIARFSRYTSRAIRTRSLHEDDRIVEALLGAGEQFGLRGWVVYATRDEVVAAIARARERLVRFFRIPTPAWETIRYANDKRLTYRLAHKLGIPNGADLVSADAGGFDVNQA